jgi:hypothetical protein
MLQRLLSLSRDSRDPQKRPVDKKGEEAQVLSLINAGLAD